jgi:chemotaxis response regulator CheB
LFEMGRGLYGLLSFALLYDTLRATGFSRHFGIQNFACLQDAAREKQEQSEDEIPFIQTHILPQETSQTGRHSRAEGVFPVVAIGASAGGLEAYRGFFHALPPVMGMAFVLIQHLDPSHESMLTEIIAKATTMPVEEVKSGVTIRPDRVYVIPPNALMALADGVFQLSPRGKTPGQHLAVNFFMHSLA